MSAEHQAPGLIKQVTSLSNPIVKSIKGLQLKKNRDAEGLFIAEGLKLVIDALMSGWRVSTLIYSKNSADQPHLQKIALKARTSGTDLLEVSEKILGSITRRDNPQSVVGVFGQQWQPLENVQPQGDDLWIALDRVRDPGNLGTIIRTADCVGAKGVILIGDCTDPWSLESGSGDDGIDSSMSLWCAVRRRNSSTGARDGRALSQAPILKGALICEASIMRVSRWWR